MDSFHFISNVDDLIPSMLQNFCESWLFVTVLFICEFSTDLSLFLTSHNGLSIEEVLFLFLFFIYFLPNLNVRVFPAGHVKYHFG